MKGGRRQGGKESLASLTCGTRKGRFEGVADLEQRGIKAQSAAATQRAAPTARRYAALYPVLYVRKVPHNFRWPYSPRIAQAVSSLPLSNRKTPAQWPGFSESGFGPVLCRLGKVAQHVMQHAAMFDIFLLDTGIDAALEHDGFFGAIGIGDGAGHLGQGFQIPF